MKPVPNLPPQIHCKHEFPFSFGQCMEAFLNWPKFNHPTFTIIHYISDIKQLDKDTLEIWQRFDGDNLYETPAYYQIQINRKNKELKGHSFVDPWNVSAQFYLKENAQKQTVQLTNTLYDGQLVNKAYVTNFDLLVVQMWRYIKFKEYRQRDWTEAQRILKEVKATATGALVSENTYS